MNQGDGMAEVTEADREKAATVLGRVLHSNDHLIGQDIIAEALAEEREKARAPFLALADDLEGRYLPFSSAQGQAYDIANEIRRAAEVTE